MKFQAKRRIYEVQQDGVSFAAVSYDAKEFSLRIVETIGAGTYKFKPAKTILLRVGQKKRLLYQFQLTDLIIHGVLSNALNEAIEPHLSPRLYSYRKGVRWWDAVSDLARYVRAYRRAHKEIETRGLYVLRRDVSKYTDSIKVDAQSEIWKTVLEALNGNRPIGRNDQAYWELVENVIRPEIVSNDGYHYSNIVGVPTGSPISTTLFNLYLMSMDHELESIPGGFYARYSDDILFAHPDPHVTESANEKIVNHLRRKGLRANAAKDQLVYLNGAGRQSNAWSEARGTSQITFLGCNVSFHGDISLNRTKMQGLLKDISARARISLRALPSRDVMTAGPIVCAAANEALDPNSHARNKYAPLLRYVVTSRPQLKTADYRIAQIVARSLSGFRNVRAFRKVPYKTMRQNWGLISLYHARNKSL